MLELPVRQFLVGIDLPVAEVADEQVAAEAAERRRRPREALVDGADIRSVGAELSLFGGRWSRRRHAAVPAEDLTALRGEQEQRRPGRGAAVHDEARGAVEDRAGGRARNAHVESLRRRR